MSGRFISFEGGEGSGKTTQIRLLAEELTRRGVPIYLTREPGGEAGAEAIRELLVTGEPERWDLIPETLLFMAARAQHLNRVILPKLAQGIHVLCDRFIDSTIVYQGLCKNLGEENTRKLHAIACGDFYPSQTFLLDIDPQEGLIRAFGRAGEENRFEKMDMEFHQHVRQHFLYLAAQSPDRFVTIDASQNVLDTHLSILNALK